MELIYREKKILFVIVSPGNSVFFFFAPQEGVEKVKYDNYTDLEIVSVKKPFNAHLFWEHSTYGLILVDLDDQTKLFISTDKGDNWAEIDLSDNTHTYKIQSGWLDGVDLWLVMCDNDGTADNFEVCFIELDDSNDCNPIGVSAGADVNTVYAEDIFKLGANIFVINREQRAGTKFIVSWDVDTAPFTEIDTNSYGALINVVFVKGVVIGSDYYTFFNSDDEIEFFRFEFEGTTNTLTALTPTGTYNIPTNINLRVISSDDTSILYFIVTSDDSTYYLATHDINGTTWTLGGVYNIVLMLDRNTAAGVKEKAFHLTEYKIYQIQENVQQLNLIAIVNTDAVIIAITDNFLMNNDGDMFEYEDKIRKLITVDIVHEIMEPPGGDVTLKRDAIPLENNMIMKFLDNYTSTGSTSEEIVFEGIIYKHTEIDNQTVNMESSAEADLDEKPSGDYSGRSDEIITSLLSDYCHYITKGTFSVGTAMGTITFGGDKTIGTILDEMVYFENWIWALTPTGVLYYNNGTVDSGINLSESDNVHFVTPSRPKEIYNRIKVKGAYVDGVQVESEWKEDLESQQKIGIKTKTFTFGFLNTIALCNIAATNLLTRLGKEPLNVVFTHQDEAIGFMQPGETITFEFNRGGIIVPSDQFLIIEVIYIDQSVGVYTIRDELP